MVKKRYVILGIVCVASALIVGCGTRSENTSNVKNNESTMESFTEIESSKEELGESETSDNNPYEFGESGVVSRYADNTRIKEIEDDPHFEGANKVIDGLLSDLVNDRFENAKNRCSHKSQAYSFVDSVIESVDKGTDIFAKNLTSYDRYNNILESEIKKSKDNIKNNKYVQELFHKYMREYRFDEPIIMDIVEDSRRSLTYKVMIEDIFAMSSETYKSAYYGSESFESVIKADFFSEYYDKNSKDIDKLYDKFKSENDGKNAVLTKFFDDNGKEFFDKVSEELDDSIKYKKIMMYVNLQKDVDKNKWVVDSIILYDIKDSGDGEVYIEETKKIDYPVSDLFFAYFYVNDALESFSNEGNEEENYEEGDVYFDRGNEEENYEEGDVYFDRENEEEVYINKDE